MNKQSGAPVECTKCVDQSKELVASNCRPIVNESTTGLISITEEKANPLCPQPIRYRFWIPPTYPLYQEIRATQDDQ